MDETPLTFEDFCIEQEGLIHTPVVRDGKIMDRVDGRFGSNTFINCIFEVPGWNEDDITNQKHGRDTPKMFGLHDED